MPKLIDITGQILSETERAYFFTDGEKKVWLPKSQVEWDEEDNTITMPEWLAIEKELV